MGNQHHIMTVAQVADICAVKRNTVGLWIHSRKLHAGRKGRNYSIPASELIFFLKSTGREIPSQLVAGIDRVPHFRPIQNCRDRFQGSGHLSGCRECAVFKKPPGGLLCGQGGRGDFLPGALPGIPVFSGNLSDDAPGGTGRGLVADGKSRV